MTSPQGKYWCFTHNNPHVDGETFLSSLKEYWPKTLTYVVFQKEQVTTPHFQGYLEFSTLTRLATLKRFHPGIHWERRKGSQQEAIDYCSRETYKDEDKGRVDGPWEWGNRAETHQGARSDLAAAIACVKEGGIRRVLEEQPEALVRYSRGLSFISNLIVPPKPVPEVILLFGPTDVGKTRRFFDSETDRWSSPVTDGLWFDGYMGQAAALFDDFAGKYTKLALSQLLRVIDRYDVELPVKGGFAWFIPERIYITTNFHPLDWYDYTSRMQQYAALERRFTRVLWWKKPKHCVTLHRPDPDASLDVTDDGPDLWRHFWDGVGRAQLGLDVATGRLVSNAPQDYYDY